MTQEFEIIEAIENRADNVYVTLCLDPDLLDSERDPTMILGAVKHTYDRLLKITDEKVNTVVLKHSRFKNDALKFLEANLFGVSEDRYKKTASESSEAVFVRL